MVQVTNQVWYGGGMGLFSRLRPASQAASVHDYTQTFEGHNLNTVKLLSDGRMFLVGVGTHVKQGDLVVARTPDAGTVYFRVEEANRSGVTWRAYARRENRKDIRTITKPGFKPRMAWKG